MRNTTVFTSGSGAVGSNKSHSKHVFTNDRVMTNNGTLLDGRLDISTPHDAREKRCGMTDDHLKVSRGELEKERERERESDPYRNR